MQAFFYIFIETIKKFKMRKLFIILLLIPSLSFSQTEVEGGVFSGIALYSPNDSGNVVVSLTSVPLDVKDELAMIILESLPVVTSDNIIISTSKGYFYGDIIVDWRPRTTLINFVCIKKEKLILPDIVVPDTIKKPDPIKPKNKFVDMQYAY